MKYLITLTLCFLSTCLIYSQKQGCDDCFCVIENGNNYVIKREYDKAIKKYNVVLSSPSCDNNSKSEAENKLLEVFEKIQRERDDAITIKSRALKAEEKAKESLIAEQKAKEEAKAALKQAQISEQKAIEERNRSKTAEEEAKIAEERAIKERKKAKIAEEKSKRQAHIADSTTTDLQAVLDALYFYEDSLALAYNGSRFGFINKKGEVLIDYRYNETAPFDYRGYAKVKKDDVDYLIDTKGTEYRWTDDINTLDKSIEAVNFDGETGLNINTRQKILKNKQLNILSLHNCNIKKFPTKITQLKQLQTLDLSNNQLSAIPAEIGQLKELRILYLSNNQLSAIPTEIGQLKELRILYLSGNQLSAIPAEIGQLRNLQTLYLSYNKLSSLPAKIVELENLQTLDLRFNKLHSLPAEIGQLRNLQTLYLSYNDKLTSLPAEIGQLANLQNLDLWNTNLSKQEIQKIKKLLPNCVIRF